MSDFIDYMKKMHFDVSKYDSLNESTDYELISQLKARDKKDEWVNAIYSYTMSSIDKSVINDLINNINFFHFLLFKNPLQAEYFQKYFSQYERVYLEKKNKKFHDGMVPNSLPYTNSVAPMSRWDLECFINRTAVSGVGVGEKIMLTPEEIENMDYEDSEKLFSLSNESLNCVVHKADLPDEFDYGMMLKIDLKKTDEEIFNDLALLLPMWRKELGLNTPERKREWSYIRRRIIDYRIIPLMDVMASAKIFSFVTGKRVTKKVIALLVYPDGKQDGFGLHQTVIPFLDKVAGRSSKLIFDYKITK